MVYKLAITNGVVNLQEADGILARFVLLPAKRLLIKTDYYAAPNCSKLCESGSGTPKGNGTQDCVCQSSVKGTGSGSCWDDYDEVGCNLDLKLNYRGNDSVRISTVCDNIGCYSVISFTKAPTDQSDIEVLINNAHYIFTADDTGCKPISPKEEFCYLDSIIDDGQYSVEFLN